MTLSDVFVDEAYNVTIKPNCLENIRPYKKQALNDGYDYMNQKSKELLGGLKEECNLRELESSWPQFFDQFLGGLVQVGNIKNFPFF